MFWFEPRASRGVWHLALLRLLSIHAREIVHSVPGVAVLIIMGLGVVLIVASVFVPD